MMENFVVLLATGSIVPVLPAPSCIQVEKRPIVGKIEIESPNMRVAMVKYRIFSRLTTLSPEGIRLRSQGRIAGGCSVLVNPIQSQCPVAIVRRVVHGIGRLVLQRPVIGSRRIGHGFTPAQIDVSHTPPAHEVRGVGVVPPAIVQINGPAGIVDGGHGRGGQGGGPD